MASPSNSEPARPCRARRSRAGGAKIWFSESLTLVALFCAYSVSAQTATTTAVPAPAPSPTPGVAAPAAPAAAAAPSTPKETIVGIRVIGYQTVSPETIGHYLGVKVGDPYEPDKIRENFQSLWDVGLLENLSVEAERSPAGVTLIVTIEERPTLKEVEFTGNKKFSTTQIKDRLKEVKLEIHSGAPMSLREIAKVRSGIADYYVENGYRSATVDFRIEDVSKTEKKLIFVIDEGDKIKIDDIKFEGNHVFGQQKLRNSMQKTKIATWFRILSDTSTVYNQANYDADVENIKALYHSVGYKDVVVKDPVLDVFIKNPKKPAAKQKKRVKITIPLVEGDQFFTGKIQIVKVDQTGQPDSADAPLVVPREVILSEFRELKTGSVLNRDLLIEGLSRVESRYKSKGYIYWFADPQYREVGNHVVDVDVKLFEGDKFFLGRLEVTGNTTTRDKVIRREFALDEGDVMNMEAVKKSLQKLQQLGYFKVNEEPEFAVRPQDKKVDLTLKGQETSRNEIQFGAGYSALDGFFGQFSFQTRNFLGRGEILGASAQLGKVSNYYDLSYTIPWFMDKNQSVGASLYSRSVDYLNIDEKRKGGSLFFGRGITLFDSWSILYQYEDVKANFPVRGAQTPPGQPIPPDKFTETTGKTSSFTPGYRWDSRNDPFDPNQGFRYYTTVQLAGEALGGTDNFIKPLLGTSKYLPLRWPKRTYFAVNLEGGWVAAYGGAGIPIFERFQIGGEQSLRGFRAGAVLPLTEKNQVFTDEFGRILGGNKFFVMNLEYVFFSLGPAKLLVFSDIGNTYHETQKFDITHVRSSVGVEMRVFLPIFQAPLRFIYSWNLHPITPIDQFGFPINSLSERKSGFDFSIGRTF